MKVSKQKLRAIISEELENISEGTHRGEGSMARHQLYRTAKLAMITRNMITDAVSYTQLTLPTTPYV